ncbi:MAG TPA: prepilin-type N-terminal cleavage/methylation domain-containing protein [Candidatus Sumerlaeota bacterium]|nr:prepilin-type N-terminal cleavage/methylation domain-containing protein [Candidatus Sumerlaeota bacterium]HOR29535.1 prepilin-type N-terminal cleavage/methylation domain-containing protein [Candidatus Sumerlaeota bacterium]HPK02810.1 prepilin-type N-terminal cleavage/methylation domain-containing protein [Candidatus Sumerlaeota bacterium]
MFSRRAFTLIELLIVVAIIAILAAIAVPNFLEAQTRAKVARVRTDFRIITVANESYYVDNNKYAQTAIFQGETAAKSGNSIQNSLRACTNAGPTELTTPIAYLTKYPWDIFTIISPWSSSQVVNRETMGRHDYPYYYLNVESYVAQYGASDPGQYWVIEHRKGAKYYLQSWGPLGQGWTFPYDPTNGTISPGTIGRWGPQRPEGFGN